MGAKSEHWLAACLSWPLQAPHPQAGRWLWGEGNACRPPTWGPCSLTHGKRVIHPGYLQSQTPGAPPEDHLRVPSQAPPCFLEEGKGHPGGPQGNAVSGRAGHQSAASPGALDSRRLAGARAQAQRGRAGRVDEGSTGRQGQGWGPGWVRGCLPGYRAASRWARCCGRPGAGAAPGGNQGGGAHAWSGGRCG